MTIKLKLKRPNEKTSVLMTEFSKNSIPFKFYTGKTIQCKNWSISKQIVLPKEENFDLINSYLDLWKTELKRIFAEMEKNRERLSKDVIQNRLDSYFKKTSSNITPENAITDFISYIEFYIEKFCKGQKGVGKLNQTKMHLMLACNLLTSKHLSDLQTSRSRENASANLKADYKLPFEDVNLKLIEKFKDYFNKATFTVKSKGILVTKYYKDNYVSKQIKNLKQFVIPAIEAKYVESFTWNTIKTSNHGVDSVYTDFEEIQKLYDVDLQDYDECVVRDKYILNCFLGMRYGDLNKLESHSFSTKIIAGKEYLVYAGRMEKTGHRIEFALHDIAREISRKYNGEIPKISLQKFNTILKSVAFKAGLTGLERIREIRAGKAIIRDVPKYELMSSHTGRRSFCTNFYNEGVAIGAIMSISGHQTESEFRKYIKKASVRLEIVAEQISAIKGINLMGVADRAA